MNLRLIPLIAITSMLTCLPAYADVAYDDAAAGSDPPEYNELEELQYRLNPEVMEHCILYSYHAPSCLHEIVRAWEEYEAAIEANPDAFDTGLTAEQMATLMEVDDWINALEAQESADEESTEDAGREDLQSSTDNPSSGEVVGLQGVEGSQFAEEEEVL